LDIGERGDAVGDQPRAGRTIGQVAPVRIVGIQDGGLRHALVAPLRQHLEQDALGLEVRLQRAVEVEVLGAEIREDREVHVDPAHLSQREGVRRRLQHAPRPTGHQQLGAELLDLERLLGALARVVLPLVVGELEVDGRGVAGVQARGFEDVGHQMHGRGLAVGPGDGRDPQPVGRMVEELGGEVGERGPRVGYDRHGQRHPHLALRDDRDRAVLHGIGNKVDPVTVEARDRDEERPFLHLARVVRDRAYVAVGRAVRDRDPCLRQQRAELHSPPPRPRRRTSWRARV
jgi:hypothetical protein